MNPSSAQAAIQPSRGRGRGRPRTIPQPPPVVQSHPARRLPQVPAPFTQPSTRLLPASGWIQPQQRLSNPSRFSLHQAHLRSPVLQAKSVPAPLYHYLHGYKMAPVRLTEAGRAIEKLSFTMTPDEMKTIAQEVRDVRGGPGVMAVDEDSRTVRLRCIKWSGKELPNKHAWAIADTY